MIVNIMCLGTGSCCVNIDQNEISLIEVLKLAPKDIASRIRDWFKCDTLEVRYNQKQIGANHIIKKTNNEIEKVLISRAMYGTRAIGNEKFLEAIKYLEDKEKRIENVK